MDRIRNIRIERAVAAGLIGTAVMTAVGLWIAPLMGLPPMDPAQTLAGAMGGIQALGWVAHLMIGTILAVIYAVVAPALPGPSIVRGALYGVAGPQLARFIRCRSSPNRGSWRMGSNQEPVFTYSRRFRTRRNMHQLSSSSAALSFAKARSASPSWA